MAELILPLVRTMFLPPGSPGIGSVQNVMGDIRDVRCGMSGGEVYCFGDADILIEYLSDARRNELFGESQSPPDYDNGVREWQAMLTFPFQLRGAGELPPGATYRVNFGPMDWRMITSRAIELETSIIIESAAAGEEPWQPGSGDERIQKGGEGNMADQEIYNFDDEYSYNIEGNIEVEETSAGPAWGQHPVEIVDLTGNAESVELQEAILKALQQTTPQPDSEGMYFTAEDARREAPAADAGEQLAEVEELSEEVFVAETPAPEPLGTVEAVAADWQPAEVAVEILPEATEEEPLAIAAAPAASLEVAPELVAAAEEASAPRKKRRFGGIPGLYIEANNNDIDLTAFKINIKL